MTETTLQFGTLSRSHQSANSALKTDQMKWKMTAVLGLASEFALLAIGLFISLLGRFFESGLPAAEINRLGTVLLVPAFPLMFLGAHALDKIHEEKKRRAIARTAHRQVQ